MTDQRPGNRTHERVGRRARLDETLIDALAEMLRRGNTKTASCAAIGFSREWIRQRSTQGAKDVEDGKDDTLDAKLFLAIEQAEANAEAAMVQAVHKAATGHETERQRVSVKTYQKTYKTKDANGNPVEKVVCRTITHPDGTIEEIPVQFEDRVVEDVTGEEFDWRAAESWLKRRNRVEWGDRADITSGDQPITNAPVLVLRGVSMDDL
jgi:hypothetical protein